MKRWRPVLLAAALAPPAAAPAAAASPAGAPAPQVPACAWEPLGHRTSNVAYPDTNAEYWLLRHTMRKGLAIWLDGRFPDARYASVATYDAHPSSSTGPGGAPSALTDHQLLPDRGSGNPYRQPVHPGGKFTVTVTDTPAGRPNTLPLAPAGTPEGAEGTVVHRIHLPHGTFRLPKVTFVRDGHRVRVGTCANALSPGAPAAGASSGPPSPAGADTPPRPASTPTRTTRI
ncbi:hypothetical protein AB0E62_29520 [Streptomyces sp. NPDC038707]|uniref:hypothetical protein n=1 Tax=Streptomyces sp. NPDC038707 TaxID=3154329 RepID=UPI0034077761